MSEYISCVGCGRLFKTYGVESVYLALHDCNANDMRFDAEFERVARMVDQMPKFPAHLARPFPEKKPH